MAALTDDQLAAFDRDGFVHCAGAFPREVAERCAAHVWSQLLAEPDDPATWTQPSMRAFDHLNPAFAEAARSPRLVEAIGQVYGPEAAPPSIINGSSVVRFPVPGDPGDDGWHVDAGFAGPDGAWWVNHRSAGRAGLLLVLLSDTGVDDAPTRLSVGSHRLAPTALEPYGEDGVSGLVFQPQEAIDGFAALPVALATGGAGDVYLCHPLLVHAAQRHHGAAPRLLAQAGLAWVPPVTGLDGARPALRP